MVVVLWISLLFIDFKLKLICYYTPRCPRRIVLFLGGHFVLVVLVICSGIGCGSVCMDFVCFHLFLLGATLIPLILISKDFYCFSLTYIFLLISKTVLLIPFALWRLPPPAHRLQSLRGPADPTLEPRPWSQDAGPKTLPPRPWTREM